MLPYPCVSVQVFRLFLTANNEGCQVAFMPFSEE